MKAQAIGADRYPRQIESFMETLLGVLFLMLVNVVFFEDDPGFLNVQPHPFLFLTILIASRYGTFDGFVAGFLCAVIYISYMFWGRDLSLLVQTFEWYRMIPAYLFIIMGLLLGEIREMANRDVLRMRHQVEQLTRTNEELKQEIGVVTRVKEELQQRILSAEDPLGLIYDSTRRLSALQPEEAYPAIMDLVEKFTGAEKFSLYMAREPDGGVLGPPGPTVFDLRFSRGWATPDEFDAALTADHPAVSMAVQTLRPVTAREMASDVKDILACAPLVDHAEGRVTGLLVVHRIPFIRLTGLTISHLQTIAAWAGKTLAEASRFHAALRARVDDEVTGLFHYGFMSRRLAEEVQRVARYGGECSLLLVKVLGADTLTADDRKRVLRDFGATLRRLLRVIDVVGAHRLPGVYHIILPETSAARSVVATARINGAFRQHFGGLGSRFAHLSLKMGIATTSSEHPKTEAEMVAEAERFSLA